jgi:hypothetical protein
MRMFFGDFKIKKPVGYNRENEKRGGHFKSLPFVDTEYASDCILHIH